MLTLILLGLGGLLVLAFLAVFVGVNLPQPLDVVLPGAPIPRFRLIWILKAVGARLRIGGTSVERLQQWYVCSRRRMLSCAYQPPRCTVVSPFFFFFFL